MKREDKWGMYGEYGGTYTSLKEARRVAKEASLLTSEEVNIYYIPTATYYIDYVNGKCTRDGWTKKIK